MTEIPANTPKPIGRTDNFLPGSWNASVEEAAAAEAETEESAAEVPLLLVPVGVALVAGSALKVVTGVGSGALVVVLGVVPVAVPDRVETPFATTPPADPEDTPGTAELVPEAADVASDVVAVPVATVVPPAEVEVAMEVVIEGEAEVVPVSVAVAVDAADVRVTDSVVVLAAPVAVPGLMVVVVDPGAVPPPANDSVHFFTSSTAGFPSLSVIGVSVISQVSVTGPAFV